MVNNRGRADPPVWQTNRQTDRRRAIARQACGRALKILAMSTKFVSRF